MYKVKADTEFVTDTGIANAAWINYSNKSSSYCSKTKSNQLKLIIYLLNDCMWAEYLTFNLSEEINKDHIFKNGTGQTFSRVNIALNIYRN